LQGATPLILIGTPVIAFSAASTLLFEFLKTSITYGHVYVVMLSFHPLIDALCTLLFVAPYRRLITPNCLLKRKSMLQRSISVARPIEMNVNS
jgi:hypothetical protein